MKRILIIDGYGNFGSFITKTLVQGNNIQTIVTGRSLDKAKALAGGDRRPEHPRSRTA